MATQVNQKEIHLEAGDSKIVRLEVSGKLTAEDYNQFVPAIEQMIEEHGRLRLLIILEDFDGWDAGAMWEDLKFDVKHFSDLQKVAIVGESKWEKGAAKFWQPFTRADVKYFDLSKRDEAERWIAA